VVRRGRRERNRQQAREEYDAETSPIDSFRSVLLSPFPRRIVGARPADRSIPSFSWSRSVLEVGHPQGNTPHGVGTPASVPSFGRFRRRSKGQEA
jgi:hypothetical protein